MDLDPAGARELIAARRATVLDVRTPEEFALEGHIPGARLLPVQELPERFSELPAPSAEEDRGKTTIVVCEHGVRSRWACEFLASRGYTRLANLAGGMSCWPYERERGIPEDDAPHSQLPSPWLIENIQHLRYGTALDVACGTGRNALLLARMGWKVTAVDRDEVALETLSQRAALYGVRIATVCRDLENGEGLPEGGFDLVIVFNYLHRALTQDLRGALRPGGVIVYETFTTDQRRFGPPHNPDFLLQPGELGGMFAGFETLASREGLAGERRAVASLVGRRPK